VQELRKVIASLKTTTPLPSSPPTSRIWHIPYRRNPLFTGREELLQQLYDRFTASNSSKKRLLSVRRRLSVAWVVLARRKLPLNMPIATVISIATSSGSAPLLLRRFCPIS
jgi:hypothetical protein